MFGVTCCFSSASRPSHTSPKGTNGNTPRGRQGTQDVRPFPSYVPYTIQSLLNNSHNRFVDTFAALRMSTHTFSSSKPQGDVLRS